MIRRPPRSTQSRSSAASDVYKRQELQLQLADDDVLLLGSVADQGDAIGIVRQVELIRFGDAAEQHPPRPLLVFRRLLIEKGLVVRALAVDVVEVVTRGAEVVQRVGVVVTQQRGGGIESDVVIDELAEVGVAGGNPGVVTFVRFGWTRAPASALAVADLAWLQWIDHRRRQGLQRLFRLLPTGGVLRRIEIAKQASKTPVMKARAGHEIDSRWSVYPMPT